MVRKRIGRKVRGKDMKRTKKRKGREWEGCVGQDIHKNISNKGPSEGQRPTHGSS